MLCILTTFLALKWQSFPDNYILVLLIPDLCLIPTFPDFDSHSIPLLIYLSRSRSLACLLDLSTYSSTFIHSRIVARWLIIPLARVLYPDRPVTFKLLLVQYLELCLLHVSHTRTRLVGPYYVYPMKPYLEVHLQNRPNLI